MDTGSLENDDMDETPPRCDAIDGEFVWGITRCLNDAVESLDIDGRTVWVCDEHKEKA